MDLVRGIHIMLLVVFVGIPLSCLFDLGIDWIHDKLKVKVGTNWSLAILLIFAIVLGVIVFAI